MGLQPRLLVAAAGLLAATCAHSALPVSLADREWWSLIERLSEPSRPFRVSDNLVSNEAGYAERVRWLRPTGGAYIGVGPEQNFSYIVALQPQMAFIVDIRRENLLLHVMYKGLFELATDRADFVARLFSRTRPSGVGADASVADLFHAMGEAPFDDAELTRNSAEVLDRLLNTRRLPLSDADQTWIRATLRTFHTGGPDLHFWTTSAVDAEGPSYRALMTARDTTDVARSFLASEAGFQFIKALHTRNLILPVVGDFSGPHTFRAIARYLREHGARVEAFYASNVSAYLNAAQRFSFCANLAALPLAPRGPFIEGKSLQTLGTRLRSCR